MRTTAVAFMVYGKTRGFIYSCAWFLTFALLCSLILLPLAPAFASETVVDSLKQDASIQESSAEEAAPLTAEESQDSEDTSLTETSEGVVSETASESPIDTNAEIQDAIPAQQVEVIDEGGVTLPSEIDTELEENASSSEQLPPLESDDEEPLLQTITEQDGEIVPTTTPNTIEDEIVSSTESATSTEQTPSIETPDLEIPLSDVVATTSTSTEPEQPGVENFAISTVFNDENAFIFSKHECAEVGDGSFYCSTASTAPKTLGTDRVFSAPDADGDREIFVERGGELSQVTKNLFDDDAPYYDESSNSIVWHRLIDGRYQIVTYDAETGEEQQITNERYNNMEPSRYGDVIAWQGWIGNDWEIMLEEGGELTMLTDNTWHDISPRINGNYIIWQTFESGAWRVKVYDRVTKSIDTIESADGASIDNPRFVLVYDAKQTNGDVETKGYDLKSGKVVPLSSSPTPVPESLPDPDQTGEERALLQLSTQQKPKESDDGAPDPEPHVEGGDTPSSTSTDDVIVSPFTEPPATSTEMSTEEPESMSPIDESSQFDIIVPSTEATNGAEIEHIPDVVVTPYVEAIDDVGDSQDAVASST